MDLNKINITKGSGESAPFDAKKLRASLERSGAGEDLTAEIIAEIEELLYDGIPTKLIYRKAFQLLKKKSTSGAGRYKLKKAIMELGPNGFAFEHFVGELLKNQGYKVEVGVIVEGHCISHEIDVVAHKEDQHFMIECKFHNRAERKSNVQVPLYVQSRFLDVKRKWMDEDGHAHKFHQGWIVTNTRFSGDAIQYGNCMGLRMIGWDYPEKGSLRERIDASGLHPVTCMTSLKRKEIELLFEEGIVLSKHLCEKPGVLDKIGIMPNRVKKVLEEAESICQLFNYKEN